jgi:Domain of unknown function (DUF4838)
MHPTRAPLFLSILTALFASATVNANPARFDLAAEGKALHPVVVSEQASPALKAVAGEVAEYLSRMTGAKFKVEAGDGSHGVVLGTLAEFPRPELNEDLQIRKVYDGREAFAIRTEPTRVLLIGATDLGASHAAYRFLEALGCRWFFPAKEWEVVPSCPLLSVSLHEIERPRILSRRIWYGYGFFADKGHPLGGSAEKDYQAWARHNRMASSFRIQAGHAWQSIIAANKKTIDAHPEYLALVKGKRQGEQLCVSNPEVRRLAADWALAYLEKHPDAEMVSLECSDGEGHCECEHCAKLGRVSDRVFGLANEAAQVLAKKCPGKMVGVLAYSQHSEPPSFELEPNVHVQLTAGFTRGHYTHDELLDLWPKKCKNLGFYEYFSVWPWDFDRLPGGNVANLNRTQRMVRRYVAAGATSFDAESGNNWGVHGRGYYIANKLLWNPEANLGVLLEDFYDKAFGPAAPAMKRYYERTDPDSEPLLSRGLIGEMFRDLEEAFRLARARPDVLARLDQLKHYLRYVHLRWLLDHEKDRAKRKELTVAALTLVYRTRYEYMNHWAAMRNAWASQAAKEFDEPTWTLNNPAVKPWLVDRPVAREETDQWFRDGLDFFQPTPVTETRFSTDLAPVQFPTSTPVVSQQTYQRPAFYALHSKAGEAIQVEITPGIIAWYRDRADLRYRLCDGAKKVVSEGKLPLNGEPHKVVMAVPGPGVYFFEAEDSAAGWRIKVEAGRPAALLNQRAGRYLHLGQLQRMFFYVPKETRELQYFWSGGPHKLLGPDGKLITEVQTSDEVVKVTVPPECAGKCWSLSPHAHGWLWFFNAPNVLAASPDSLLLPSELVHRDGLGVQQK